MEGTICPPRLRTRCCDSFGKNATWPTWTATGETMRFVGGICERLSLVALEGNEYAEALEAAASFGIVGGGVYDAILAHCALKAEAEMIYSWNAGAWTEFSGALQAADNSGRGQDRQGLKPDVI
jgi:hypothetical protein